MVDVLATKGRGTDFLGHLGAGFVTSSSIFNLLRLGMVLAVFLGVIASGWHGMLFAVPSTQGLVDAAVGVALGLLAGQLGLHAGHPGTEGLATSGVLGGFGVGGGRLEVPAGGFVVRSTALGIKAALGVLPLFTCPGLAHRFYLGCAGTSSWGRHTGVRQPAPVQK